MTGIEAMLIERKEQLGKHNKSVKYDIKVNSTGQLREGARKLITHHPELLIDNPPEGWDKELWKKMCLKPYKERLVIAGSLLAAEYDRIEFVKD